MPIATEAPYGYMKGPDNKDFWIIDEETAEVVRLIFRLFIGGKRHVAYCSEYHKGKAKNPKCHSPHIMDADLLMQTIAEVLKKIEDYSISNRAEFEALVKKNLAMQQTDQTKKQQKENANPKADNCRNKGKLSHAF